VLSGPSRNRPALEPVEAFLGETAPPKLDCIAADAEVAGNREIVVAGRGA